MLSTYPPHVLRRGTDIGTDTRVDTTIRSEKRLLISRLREFNQMLAKEPTKRSNHPTEMINNAPIRVRGSFVGSERNGNIPESVREKLSLAALRVRRIVLIAQPFSSEQRR